MSARKRTRRVRAQIRASSLSIPRSAAAVIALDRRTRDRAVGTEHAAIAREGLEPFTTALAVIEELAGIGRHRLDSLIAAFGASQCGLKLHIGSARLSLNILF
jgi:hypothetical protein